MTLAPDFSKSSSVRAARARSSIASTSPRSIAVACKLRYAVRDGIPVMLVDEATPL